MSDKRAPIVWEEKRRELLAQMPEAHAEFQNSGVFGGPSLHFHLRALEAANEADYDLFSELLYALLVSWGMHRMGKSGPKMRPFNDFKASLVMVAPAYAAARSRLAKASGLGQGGREAAKPAGRARKATVVKPV